MNTCPNCGKKLNQGETVCTNCGVNILEEKEIIENTVEQNEDIRPKRFVSKKHYGPNLFKHDEDFLLLNEYIGKNVAKMKNGFSWCSFFFGPFYMFYRKMWVLGVITLILYALPGMLIPNATIALVVELMISLVLGVKFKDIYLDKALKEIDIIKANNPDKSDEDLIPDVAYKGGVSQIALMVVIGIIIVAVIVNGALVLSGLKTAGGSIYEFAKDRLNKSKDSLNQIKDNIRDNTETNAVGDLYIVFPKGYTATTEVYEENATFTNNVLSCNVITKYVDSVDYNYSPTDYLNNKINNSFLEYKNIKIKNYDWIMVKSPDSSPRFVTYVATYEGKIYDVTFETNSENPELCFVSSDAAALTFLFKQKRDY